jgi:hypothetical protein
VINIHAQGYRWANSGMRTYNYIPELGQLQFLSAGGFAIYSIAGMQAWCLCQRPLIVEEDTVSEEFTDRSGIYFLANQGVELLKFRKACVLKTLEHINDMNQMLGLSGLPVEIFKNLPNKISEIKSDLQKWYDNSLQRGEYLV